MPVFCVGVSGISHISLERIDCCTQKATQERQTNGGTEMIIVEKFPQCDICDEVNADIRFDNAGQVRDAMKYNGWKKTQLGQDVCPMCAEDLFEPTEEN
jgi:hypothetical protein